MKKILTLMAAISAASGAFAHDYNWTVGENPKTDVPGTDGFGVVKECFGDNLKYNKAANKLMFQADAGDKITLEATGDNYDVLVDGSKLQVTIENGKTVFNVESTGNVIVRLSEGTSISNIFVQSNSYRTVSAGIDATKAIFDQRINDISKYVTSTPDFYLAVKKYYNEQAAFIDRANELLKACAEKDGLDKEYPTDDVDDMGTIPAGTKGVEYLLAYLEQAKVFVGTKGEGAQTDEEKGTILVEAQQAHNKYNAIVKETQANVKAAKDDITVRKGNKYETYVEGKSFYKKITVDYDIQYVERWNAKNTASATRALDLFKTYVEDFYDTQKKSAVDSLNMFDDQTGLDALPKQFDKVAVFSENLYNRYMYEEATNLKAETKNYNAIKGLADVVANMNKLVGLDSKGKDLFDKTGLDAINTQSENLFKAISSTENKHLISDLAGEFTTPYNTISASIKDTKLAWGKAAQAELNNTIAEVQADLDKKSNLVSSKYQNDAEKLKKYQQDFARQQVEINKVKNAIKDVSTEDKAYNVACNYNDNVKTLAGVNEALKKLWTGTQSAENQAIIAKNIAALGELEKALNDARLNYNKAVEKLDSYRSADFFKEEYTSNGKEFANLKDTINMNIKTIYDYSLQIEKAYEDAEKYVKKCNNEDVVNDEVKSVIADLTTYDADIDRNARLISDALAEALTKTNEAVKDFYEYDDEYVSGNYANAESKVDKVKKSLKLLATKEYKTLVDVKTDGTYSDAAFNDALGLLNVVLNGEKDKLGKLIESDKDIANAKVKAKEFYEATPQTLADDIVNNGKKVVGTILKNSKNQADNIYNKAENYIKLKKQLNDVQVDWSVNKAKAEADKKVENYNALVDYLAATKDSIAAAWTELTEVKKLDVDVEKFTETINKLKGYNNISKDPKTFGSYNDIVKAQEKAEKSIANAEAEYKKLTKENAKTTLKTAIDNAKETVEAAAKDLETALVEKNLNEKAEDILKRMKSVDLTEAVKNAKKLDQFVEGDLNDDGVVDKNDLFKANKMWMSEDPKMDDNTFADFLTVYKNSLKK